MANGHGGVGPRSFLKQEIGDGFANDVAPADDDDVAARGFNTASLQQLNDARGCAGDERVFTQEQLAEADWIEAIDILVGGNGADNC